MGMKRLFFLFFFIISTINVWSLDLMSIASRAVIYLAGPIPEAANSDGNIIENRMDDKNGKAKYMELWYFEVGRDKRVSFIHFFVYEKDKTNLNNILKDLKNQAVARRFSLFYEDQDKTIYEKDGIGFIFANSVENTDDGELTFIQLSIVPMATLMGF